MNRPVLRLTIIAAILLAPAIARADQQFGAGSGVTSFMGRRGPIQLQSSDLPNIPGTKLPTPTQTSLGGITETICAAHQFTSGIANGSVGTSTCLQPSFGDVAGLLSASQIAPGAALSNLGFLPLNKAGDTMTGRLGAPSLTNGLAPSFTQLSGAGIPIASTLFSFVQGTAGSPILGMGYTTPMAYLERWDNSSGTAATSDWGNARLAPILSITGVVGPANVNNVNGIAIQIEADYADTAGSNYPTTGISILNQCNPGSGNKCRDMNNLNLVASWVSGNAPNNMNLVEGDSIPFISATLTHPGAGGSNYSGFWAQAAGVSTYSSAGLYCSNSTTTNGWNWCTLAEGNFADYAIYINNTLNQAQGKGLYVNTAYAGTAGTIASFGSNGVPYFTLDGSGAARFLKTGAASSYASAPTTFSGGVGINGGLYLNGLVNAAGGFGVNGTVGLLSKICTINTSNVSTGITFTITGGIVTATTTC